MPSAGVGGGGVGVGGVLEYLQVHRLNLDTATGDGERLTGTK